MNLSERSVDKELFSGVSTKENTMNLFEKIHSFQLFYLKYYFYY
jgi:hypothetical protein